MDAKIGYHRFQQASIQNREPQFDLKIAQNGSLLMDI